MENVNSTLIQKDIIIFSNYNVVVHLMFDFVPKAGIIYNKTGLNFYNNTIAFEETLN